MLHSTEVGHALPTASEETDMIASRLRIGFLALGVGMGPAFGQVVDGRRLLPAPQTAAEAGLTTEDWAGIQAEYELSRRVAGEGDDPGMQTMTGGSVAQQAYLKGHNTDIGDYFGSSVSVSGDTVVIGAPSEDTNPFDNSYAASSGAVYVFVRRGTTWTEQAYLKASNSEQGDWFGYSVSLSGDTLVVGAAYEDSGATGVNGDQNDNSVQAAGAGYVFVRHGTIWTQEAYLKASAPDVADLFGVGVAVSGDTVVVSACWEDSGATGVDGDPTDDSATDAGAAYVFVRNGTTWNQQAYLKARNTGARDSFGGDGHEQLGSVAIDGDTIVVGAFGEDSNSNVVNGNGSDNSEPFAGAAYVFVRTGNTWSQQAYLKASNSQSYGFFGYSVSVSEDTVAVGAIGGPGAAYAFRRNGTTWTEEELLQPSNPSAAFGQSVSVSADTILVGEPWEPDPGGYAAGEAYVFVDRGTNWIEQARFQGSNTDLGDMFGFAVSLEGNTVVVGAHSQGDPYLNAPGAAYVFSIDRPPASYCTGKTTSSGCVPFVSFTGSPSASTGSFLIRGNDHLVGQQGLLIYSTSKGNLNFHGGKLCVKVPFRRMPMVKSTDGIPCTCAGNCRMFELDFNQVIQSGQDPMLTQGQCVNAQWRQLDPADQYGDALSDGLSFIVGL